MLCKPRTTESPVRQSRAECSGIFIRGEPQSHICKPVVRGKGLSNFLPYLGKAIAKNAEIPFAEISKRSDLHMIVSVAQPLCNFADQGLSKGGRGILTPEMGKGMEYNVLKLSLVSQPLDML